MAILSIQSGVVVGHVGNASAVPALQAMGEEVFALPTVLLSHHPGHGGARGQPMPAGLLHELLAGMSAHGALARVEAILSGYLGAPEAAGVVSAARALVPDALYLCDPVMGDEGRLYVAPAVADAVRALAAGADIVTPNGFELGLLAGVPVPDRQAAFAAMARLGPPGVVVTSFAGADTPAGALDILVQDAGAREVISVRARARHFNGAGDLFAALLLACRLRTGSLARAARAATGATQLVLDRTEALGRTELAIVAARAALGAAARPEEAGPEEAGPEEAGAAAL